MPHEMNAQNMGRVCLVGAGPGAADLLTLRAARLIEGAQALLYDALVGPEILDMAPRGCVRIQTGKRGGRPSMRQETINKMMLRLARRGLNVVRLKGGDPSIFGRVHEERVFLERHGVEVETVPGITAVCAAAAEFGIPLTHRGMARRLVLTTGRLQGGAMAAQQARELSDQDATLALYMGADVAADAARQLIESGRAAATPVLIAEAVSTSASRCTETSLQALAAGAGFDRGAGPVLLIIGDVAALEASGHLSGQRGEHSLTIKRRSN
ncbi:MAG: uroporphyrinogen-III C-methyltransferase [Caulobacterales bacterium]